MFQPTFNNVIHNATSYLFYKETEFLQFIASKTGCTTSHLELAFILFLFFFVGFGMVRAIMMIIGGVSHGDPCQRPDFHPIGLEKMYGYSATANSPVCKDHGDGEA